MRISRIRVGVVVLIALVAWASLFARQYLHVRPLEDVPAAVFAAVAFLALAGLAPAALPRRIKAPVAASGLLTVLAGIALIGAGDDGAKIEGAWRASEEREISSVLDAVGDRVENLLALSASIGETAGALLRDSASRAAGDTVGVRLNAFQLLDSLSDRITQGGLFPEGTEIGIQLFDSRGRRQAWAGWPQFLDTRERGFIAGGDEVIYSRQVSLYRMLTHIVPVRSDRGGADAARADSTGTRVGCVVIDMPLEVNYLVNNKFLKSASLADGIAGGAQAEIRFEYFPGDVIPPDGPRTPWGRVAVERSGEVEGSESTGLSRRATVRSPLGNALFNLTVQGRPFEHFLQAREDRASAAANLAIFAALLLYFGVSLAQFPLKLSGPAHVFKAVYLAAGCAFARYALVWFQPDFFGTKIKVFEPAVFATPMLGGLMRSAGDLLITAMVFIAALYGVIKVSRGAGPAARTVPARAGWGLVVFKGLVAAGVTVGAFLLTREFIGSVVTNANPRLVGETVRIFEPEVAVLHLSAFLMVAGIFLAGMICVWGVFRLGGGGGASRAAVVGAVSVVAASLVLFRLDMTVIPLLMLLFAVIAPRRVQREDLVSIVIGAFCFVIIVSTAAYVFFNQEYQGLRRTFIQEKAVEVTHPADNWKVFILEDILDGFSQEFSIRETLTDRASPDVQRLAFDLWAGSPLSLLGYSCAIHVFDQADSLVSRFAVEMPYRLRPDEPGERLETPSGQEWAVLDLTTQTPQGAVRFYRGIVNLENYVLTERGTSQRVPVGKIVVDIPFFFESLVWAARTGPQTPEVLRNIQEGGITPRLEETEPILLAKAKDGRVLESSSEVLPVGHAFDSKALDEASSLEWPLLRTSGATYRFLAQPAEDPGVLLIAGFAVPTPVQHVLRWSTILSLYFFFTIGLIVVIIALRSVPLVGRVLPTLTPGRRLGFQQKLLGSFLLVALLPAVILGVFSVRIIRERFVQENRNEALSKALSSAKSLNNLVVDELHGLVDHVDIEALLRGELPPNFRYADRRLARVIAMNEPSTGETEEVAGGRASGRTIHAGGRSADGGRGPLPDGSISEPVALMSPERVFVHYVGGKPYLGVTSDPFPFVFHQKKNTYIVYYARRIDADLLGEISDEVGADVNIFDGGELVATSREGLLSGGFISPTMNVDAFVAVSLMGVDHSISTEKAGSYRYQVAYVPLPSAGSTGNAAIGVPLLFRSESYSVEVDKARSVVLSIFALLSAATIGLGLLLARGIFEPLKALLEGTKRISRGDFSFALPGKRKDEIGTVVEAFNEMTRQVSRSQAALEERRKYLEVILVNVATGVISTDSANRVTAVNSAAERILGLQSAKLLGKTAGELAGAGILPDFFARLASLSQGGTEEPAMSSEVDIVKDGQKRTIKFMHTAMSTDGRYLGTVFVFEDLTELINSKKLSAWVEMARQIAHEIKNPLTPIKLSTQFMVRAHQEKSGDFDKIFEEGSETIMQQVDVLRNIASEFSSFGRLQHLYLAPHPVVPLVEEIIYPYRRNSAGVQVSVDASSETLRAVIDPEAVRKICTNLIENAMEAMIGGGELRVSCDETALDGRTMVRISFRDSGPGLSDEVKEHLFEPYFSTKTTGTGLGLAICRSLSREMGGDVTLSNLAQGHGLEAALYLKRA
jgi:two-component system nitrogen regulation sensor histidine kinase NtrY